MKSAFAKACRAVLIIAASEEAGQDHRCDFRQPGADPIAAWYWQH